MSCHACNGTGQRPCQDHIEACEICGGFAMDFAFQVCVELCDAQRFYEFHACEPESMPGNQYYSDKFMAIIRHARDVLDRAGVPSCSLGDPLA